MKKDMKKKKMMGYKAGGLKMVEKGGKKVPFFAADGKGKMMGGGKVMRYAEGDMIDIGGVGGAPGDEITRGTNVLRPDDNRFGRYTPRPKPKPKPKPKPSAKQKDEKKKMMGGGMMKYNKGGKVRGCGVARQGVRNAKMVVMKGS